MMRYLIITRSDRQGSQVVARLGVNPRKRVAVPYNHGRSVSDNHWAAARALADKLGYTHVGFDEVAALPGELGFVAW